MSKGLHADARFGQGGGSFWGQKQSGVAWLEKALIGQGQGPAKRALEAFGFLMLKYVLSYILETIFSHFCVTVQKYT